jgi:hypothetical protein
MRHIGKNPERAGKTGGSGLAPQEQRVGVIARRKLEAVLVNAWGQAPQALGLPTFLRMSPAPCGLLI